MFCTRARSCARADDAKSCAVGMRNAKPGNRLKPACAGADIDAINYATEYTTKIKAKLSYCDQINFNEPVLRLRTPE